MTSITALLTEMCELRDEIIAELPTLTPEELLYQTDEVPWRIRHLLYRFAAHGEEHVNQIIYTPSAVGAAPTLARLILGQFRAVRGRLEAALIAMSDEDALRSPRQGEWSVADILRHVLESDLQHLAWIRHNRQRLASHPAPRA